MKLREILERLDLSKQEEFYIDDDFLLQFETSEFEFDYSGFYKNPELTLIPIIAWYCTDQNVGRNIILLNEIPVALSNQIGRKWDIDYEFFSKESFENTKKYLEKFVIKNEKSCNLIDLDCEFSTYAIEFAGQFLEKFHSRGFYNNQPVTVEVLIDTIAKVIFINGETKIVNLEEINFPLANLKE